MDNFRKPIWLIPGVGFIAASLFVWRLGIVGCLNDDILSAVGLFRGSYFVDANVIRRVPFCILYLIHLILVDLLGHRFEALRVANGFCSIQLAALIGYLGNMLIAWMFALVTRQRTPLAPTDPNA